MTEKATSVMLGDKEEGLIRFSYPALFKPKVSTNDAGEATGEPKYGVCIMIDKKYKKMIKRVEAAIEAAVEKGQKELVLKGKRSSTWKMPLRDGDVDREGAEYEGMMFLNASSKGKPGVIDKKGLPIEEDDVDGLYPGCYGRVTINFYAYNKGGGVGVAAGLGNVQKIKDGERLAGRTSAEEDFGGDAWEDDEEESEL